MYKVTIIGAGNIAAGFDSPESEKVLTHAHAVMANPDFELLGFYDKDERKAMEAAERWGGKVYADMESALKNADVVFCCVPDQLHGQVLKEIARFQPKLVVAEKPLTVVYEEAEKIQELYQGKIPLVVNYSRRFLREFHLLKDEINLYGKFMKGIGYYGKGTIHNGSHMVDLLRFLLGEVTETQILKSGIFDFTNKDPSKDMLLKIKDGVFYMTAIDCNAVTIFEMELFFEKARIRIVECGEKIEIYHVIASDTYVGEQNYKLVETRYVDYSGAMLGLLDNVKNHLEKCEKIYCTVQDGLEDLKICMN